LNASLWKWTVQLRIELRLLFCSWQWMLLPLLFALWGMYGLYASAGGRDIFSYSYEFHQLQHLLSLGIAMLLGMLLVRRDVVNSSYDWFKSHPVSSGALTGAKFTAGLLYMSLFTAGMAAVLLCFGQAWSANDGDLLRSVLADSLQYTWSYAVTLALAMLLAVCIPGRAVYLIGFCAWMFGTLFMEMFIITKYDWYFLKTFHLSQYYITIPDYWDEVWGISRSGREMLYSRIFVAGFIFMLLAVMSAVLKLSRPSATFRRSVWLAGGSIVLAGLLFVPYGLLWKDRYGDYRERAAGVVEAPEAIDQYRVDSYDIRLTRTGDEALRISAVLRLPDMPVAAGQPLYITLNRSFHLRSVTLNGLHVQWTRDGDWIAIDVSGHKGNGKQELVFEYEGAPRDWMPSVNGGEARPMFIDGEDMYLPGHLAWYPLPGKQLLYVKLPGTEVLTDDRRNGFPGTTEVRLTVDGFSRKVYSTLPTVPASSSVRPGDTQLFADKQAEGITLVAGRFREVKVPQTDTLLVTGASDADRGGLMLSEYAKAVAYFNQWLDGGVTGLHTIFYFPMAGVSVGNLYQVDQITGRSLFINKFMSNVLSSYELSDAIHAGLFGDRSFQAVYSSNGRPGFSLIAEIRYAFYLVYYAEHSSAKHSPDGEWFFDSTQMTPQFRYMEGDQRVTGQVKQALADGRTDLVKRVLKSFYKKGLRIKGAYLNDYPVYTYEDWQNEWRAAEKAEAGE
jgi:hypothetical protein